MPICFCVVGVAVFAPRVDFGRELGCVGNAAGEALAGENREFGLGQIEPAAVFGCVVPLEPFDDAAASDGPNALYNDAGVWVFRLS